MRRKYTCSFLWFASVIILIWLWVSHFGGFPSTESSCPSHCLSTNRLMSTNGGDSLSVPVPIHLLMTGEPIPLMQDDVSIINYIWSNGHLMKPSTEPYNLKKPNDDPSKGQGQVIRKILRNMTHGFFVECGALDGETRSNTLFMEQHLNWKGLLIEADPANYEIAKTKNRKAYLSNACLSIKPYPHQVTFLKNFNKGRILDSNSSDEFEAKKKVKVQCFPLFSLLSALKIFTVDYFSLDVEGSELKVLKTIPFDKIMIKTLSVEFFHTGEGKKALKKFMESKGYIFVQEVRYPNNLANDMIFAHNSVHGTEDFLT